jgi:hypothetical protein
VRNMVADWQDYLEAAERKLDIATYHACELERELASRNNAGDALPPIPVQAHFEGVVVSLMSAVDQVAEAMNSSLGHTDSMAERRERAGRAIAKAIPDVAAWYRNPLQQDLRDLRVLMLHYAYRKTPEGQGWVVESTNSSRYQGSRELVPYAKDAVRYFERLRDLLPRIQGYLSKQRVEQHRKVTR